MAPSDRCYKEDISLTKAFEESLFSSKSASKAQSDFSSETLMTLSSEDIEPTLKRLVTAIVEAVVAAKQSQNWDEALAIRDQLKRLPNALMTEVINDVMLNLIKVEPDLCRWFILDVFLCEADPAGKADVAERINLLMADLNAHP